MRKIKIIADSSSDVLFSEDIDFASVPLKIITDEREFVDDASLNITEMVEYLNGYKKKSRTSCPNIGDWISAFEDADDVICVTITSGLSGSYNAACSAKKLYEEQNAGRRVLVIDSLSTGPAMRLIVEKLREYVIEGRDFESISEDIMKYKEKLGLYFILKSIKNLANNGRVSPIVAKIIGIAGIRIVGRASKEGTLEQTDKCRGEVHSLARVVEHLKSSGFAAGRIRIAHCQNESAAKSLASLIEKNFKQADVKIFECRGLCSFYAENGGILIGYEKA